MNYELLYLQGVERAKLKKEAEEKARLPDTRQGLVPLRRGKYGMDVEEYLEWCQQRHTQYKVKKP